MDRCSGKHGNCEHLEKQSAPQFELEVSNQTPVVGESVQDGGDGVGREMPPSMPTLGTLMNNPLINPDTLNQKCDQSKVSRNRATTVVRVVVSDMKGGLASRNLVIVVEGAEVGNEPTSCVWDYSF